MGILISMDSINDYIESSHIEISFFGSRMIYSNSSQESVKLCNLVVKVTELGKNIISTEEKKICNLISKKSIELYEESEGKLKKAYWITRIFQKIRAFLRFDVCLYTSIQSMPTFEN